MLTGSVGSNAPELPQELLITRIGAPKLFLLAMA